MPRTTLLRTCILVLGLFVSAAGFSQSQSSSASDGHVNSSSVTSVLPAASADASSSAQENTPPSSLDQSDDSSNAYSRVRIVRVSYVDGDVRIDRGDNQGFVKAFSNMPLVEGSRLSTEADGRAEAEFEDGSTIRLAGNSTLDFQQLQLGKNGEHVTTVSLEHGEAYFGIKKKR